MEDLSEFVHNKNAGYKRENIKFTSYCEEKIAQREINKETIISLIMGKEKPLFVEKQEASFQGNPEERYKAIYRISSRYFLIIILAYDASILKVINIIKSSKDLETKWRKKISK